MGRLKSVLPYTPIVVEKGEAQFKIRKWKAIEEACGLRLSKDLRDQLQGALSRLALTAHAEQQDAPPLANALERIDEIRRTAQACQEPNGSHKDAVSFAETLVDSRLAALNFPRLTELMSLVVHACDDSEAQLIKFGRKRPKEAFTRFIWEVTDILDRACFPTVAGSNEYQSKPTPFTALVWALLESTPKDYDGRPLSPLALTKAIQRARRVRAPGTRSTPNPRRISPSD